MPNVGARPTYRLPIFDFLAVDSKIRDIGDLFPMATHTLSQHFASFFRRLNPGMSFDAVASSQYNTIKGLIEDPHGLAAILAPKCFLQGSYRQQTAIDTINDVDIVALCRLWQPGGGGGGRTFERDEIFDIIAAPLKADGRYKAKVRYGPQSMCVKVDLGILVEILPVVYKAGTDDVQKEPFRLYRPEHAAWEDGYARYHQQSLTWKNSAAKTASNFISAIKVFKHLRSRNKLEAVSFHIECLLFSLPDSLFVGSPADFIPVLLEHIANQSALTWFTQGCATPCKDRKIFTPSEWSWEKWQAFHQAIGVWSTYAKMARDSQDRNAAITVWQILLGDDYFPTQPST